MTRWGRPRVPDTVTGGASSSRVTVAARPRSRCTWSSATSSLHTGSTGRVRPINPASSAARRVLSPHLDVAGSLLAERTGVVGDTTRLHRARRHVIPASQGCLMGISMCLPRRTHTTNRRGVHCDGTRGRHPLPAGLVSRRPVVVVVDDRATAHPAGSNRCCCLFEGCELASDGATSSPSCPEAGRRGVAASARRG